MALKVKWGVKTSLNIVNGSLFSTCSSNAAKYNCKYLANGSYILNEYKNAQLKSWIQHCRAFSMTYEEAVNKKQKIGADKTIIYYGELSSKIKGLKVMSYSSSVISVISQPFIYDNVMSLALPLTAVVYTMLGFLTFVTPILIHSFSRKYVTEIQYDPSEDLYTFKTLTFFLKEKAMTFKLCDVKRIDSYSLFNTFFIKGKPMMIFEEGFLNEDHYIKMLGYDKPIDLRMNENASKNEAADLESTK